MVLVLCVACRTIFPAARTLVDFFGGASLTLKARAITQEQRNVCAAAVGTAEACSRTEAAACCPARKAAISTVSPILLPRGTMFSCGIQKSGVYQNRWGVQGDIVLLVCGVQRFILWSERPLLFFVKSE